MTDPHLVEECIEAFANQFPSSRIFSGERNLGVALNFDRAEEYFFSELGADAAFFFEDDLILSPYYIDAVEKLMGMALNEPRLGYVAAYGDHHASLVEQKRSPTELILMRHKWGFGLTKRQWLLQKPIVEPYLEIIRRCDYRARDHDAIRAYYRTLGLGSAGTSQDAMKDVASALLGTAKGMTYVCFGKNIGEHGLHSESEFYEKEGFGRTEMYDEPINRFDEISEGLLESWVHEMRRAAVEALENL